MTSLGIRSNNPGNLRPLPQGVRWKGETTPPGANYCSFDTPENGLRAMGLDIKAKYFVHQLTTISEIITRYAPPNENDTQAYIDDVCHRTGYLADAWFPLHEPNAFDALMKAMIEHENGEQPYSDYQIAQAVVTALAGVL